MGAGARVYRRVRTWPWRGCGLHRTDPAAYSAVFGADPAALVPPMSRITSSIRIRREPAAVFDFFTTPANAPRWHPASVSVAGAVDHQASLVKPSARIWSAPAVSADGPSGKWWPTRRRTFGVSNSGPAPSRCRRRSPCASVPSRAPQWSSGTCDTVIARAGSGCSTPCFFAAATSGTVIRGFAKPSASWRRGLQPPAARKPSAAAASSRCRDRGR